MQPPSRGVYTASAAVIALAFAGFFTGTRETGRSDHGAVPPSTGRSIAADVAPHAKSVPRYADMRVADYRANAGIYSNTTELLARGLPDPLAAVALSDEERARAVARRREHRAYDGAPPTIPHVVGQLEPSGCLVCHEQGANVAGRIAPRISHTRHTSCLQCHVVAAYPGPEPSGDAVANTFTGHDWGKGTRAWAGAPPTIPHPTWMREECTSCHGPEGLLGLRSSHPWRASCQQCHAPSAALDQRTPRGEKNL